MSTLLLSLALGEQHQGALSDEVVTEVWAESKSESISKSRKLKDGAKGAEAPNPDEKEAEVSVAKTLITRKSTESQSVYLTIMGSEIIT